MSALVVSPDTPLAALGEMFSGVSNKDLSEGVGPGFPVISFRGKVWRIVANGEEKAVLNPEGDPVSSIYGVVVKASPQVSKLYYEKSYQEGDDASPDCYSVNGVQPDPASPKKQSQFCATCPKNQWGSKVSEAGQKLKACADNRRLAVVPYPNIEAETGPMLLRVPPASLGLLAKVTADLEKTGVPYPAVVMKMSFDMNLAYPKLMFTPMKVLAMSEAKAVKVWLDNEDIMGAIFDAPMTDVVRPTEAQKGETPANNGVQPSPDDEATYQSKSNLDDEIAAARAKAAQTKATTEAARLKREADAEAQRLADEEAAEEAREAEELAKLEKARAERLARKAAGAGEAGQATQPAQTASTPSSPPPSEAPVASTPKATDSSAGFDAGNLLGAIDSLLSGVKGPV